jgi:sirohydrochlorin ferrochelatase
VPGLARPTKAQRRLRHARRLLSEYRNDWYGGIEDVSELAESRYAVCFERDNDGWVDGTDDLSTLARMELGTLRQDDAEWIDGVMDLETGEWLSYRTTTTITVTLADGTTYTADDRPEEDS